LYEVLYATEKNTPVRPADAKCVRKDKKLCVNKLMFHNFYKLELKV